MIREAMEKIQALALEAQGRLIIKVDSEPKDMYMVRLPDGTLERRVAEPAPRSYSAFSLPGFCDQVRHFAQAMEGVCVFVGRGAVTAVLGEETRRHRITLPLRHTEGFRVLLKPDEELKGMGQSELLWLLRSTFRGQVFPASLVPDIKQIKFRSSSANDAEIGQGRASIGKSVMAEMVGAGGELPEEVQLSCPVYEDLWDDELKLEHTFLLALAIDLGEQEFTLKPLPGEVDSGALKVMESIAQRVEWRLAELITSGKVRVFRHSEP